jgi:hypothetical protein
VSRYVTEEDVVFLWIWHGVRGCSPRNAYNAFPYNPSIYSTFYRPSMSQRDRSLAVMILVYY